MADIKPNKYLLLDEENSMMESSIKENPEIILKPVRTPVKAKISLEDAEHQLVAVLEAMEDLLSGELEGEEYEEKLKALEAKETRIGKLIQVKRWRLSKEISKEAMLAEESRTRNFALNKPAKVIEKTNLIVEVGRDEVSEAALPELEHSIRTIEEEPGDSLNRIIQVDKLEPEALVPVYEEPCTIAEVTKEVACQLKNNWDQLVEPWRMIDMLEPINAVASLNLNSELGKEKNFVVEAIKEHRKSKNGYAYLVKWKGYPIEDDSWISARYFNHEVTHQDYWKKRRVREAAEASLSTKGLGGSYVKSSAAKMIFSGLSPRARPNSGKKFPTKKTLLLKF